MDCCKQLPNTIIAGAPKCGTSSVFNWLSSHPEVCGSDPKETFYLMDRQNPLINLDFNYYKTGLKGYQYFFEKCDTKHKIFLEATTHYIYQKTALEVLSSFPEKPKIVFILRKPSDRIFSSFQYTKNNKASLEKSISFSDFINIINSHSSNSLERYCHPKNAYVLKNDIKYSCYIEYISDWVSRFGKDKIHVFLFEDLIKNPRDSIKKISKTVGIDADFFDDHDFSSQNQTFFIKNQWLHQSAMEIGKLIPKNQLRTILKNTYLNIQSSQQPTQQIIPEDRKTLAELDNYFVPFNQRLAKEFNLDLSAWE